MVWVVKKEKLLREEEEEQRPTLCKFSLNLRQARNIGQPVPC